MEKSKFVVGSKTGNSKYTKVFTLDVAKTAQTFHKGFKAYKVVCIPSSGQLK